MDSSDLYKTLQVDPNAEFDVIRAAHRVLAAKHHPDVGGSAEMMSAINRAWTILSNPTARAAHDRERRLRSGGGRLDAYASAVVAEQARATGTVLEFGRYAGWTINQVAQTDPDFLEWLARSPNGRRYRAEIDKVLARGRYVTPPAAANGQRTGFRRR
jgi:curved DNA-binding protein CbpA